MFNFSLGRTGFVLSIALAELFLNSNAKGGTILYDNLLLNPSFENSTSLTTCPTSWTCTGPAGSGLVGTYMPTSIEYVAGSDGLSGSLIAPSGNNVATTPIPVEGSGAMYQTGLGTYVAGNTYTLDLWIGTPLAIPSVTGTAAGTVGRISIYFLGNSISQLQEVDATPSATPGQWTFQQFSFTPTGAQVGQSVGLEVFVSSAPLTGGSGNNRVTDFDIAPTTTPEPGSICLIGLGLVGFGFVSRRLRKHTV